LEFLDLPETSCELQPIPSLYFLNFHQWYQRDFCANVWVESDTCATRPLSWLTTWNWVLLGSCKLLYEI
jgi:hypothetical protein